jgi:hypothetical protein
MTRSRITFVAVLFLAVAFLATPSAFSQTITTGDIVGVVTDTSGAIVPNATVTIKSLDTGETRTDKANTQGQYRFALLKPGDYIVAASTAGLKSNNSRVSLLVGQEQETNLTMNPQGTSTIIEVTSESPIVQTENANLETNYNQSQVVNLPMAGGDLTTLAMTVPGIRVNVTGGSSNMNANGIPGASILYTLNGMDQNDPANNINNSGASNNLLGANSVAEVAVVLNAYGAEYGRMAGGQVNMIGFSGTNQFHGNLFYNFNWEDLNANSFFNNKAGTPRPRSDAHQFGGRVGGPVLKNKVFFFFDDENLRYVLPSSTVVSLPSPQLQAYTLAHVPAASLPLYQDYFNLIAGSPGINRAVPVSNGSGLLQDGKNHLGCGTGTFTGTSDGSVGTFGVNVPCAIAFGNNANEINTEQQYTIRADYNATNTQKFFFRVESDAGIQATGTSPVNPLYNSVSNQPSWQGNMNYSWVITPTLVNNLNASVLWYTALFGLADFPKSETVMPEAIAISDGGANGGGFTPVGGGAYPNGFPVGRNVGHGQLNDDLSWTHGRHTIKAGVDFRYDKYTNSQVAQNAFLGRYTLNDLADFANGKLNSAGANLGSSFAQTYPVYGAVHFRVPALDMYISDEWAVTKNLKVTFGLRMEKDLNPSCVEDCYVLTNVPFNSSSYQGGASVPYSTTLLTKSNLFYNAEAPIWQPRFGVAYKPFHSDKTVIRGGIGLFSTNYTDGLAATLADQTPNSFTPSGLTTGNVGLAGDPTSSAYTAQQSATAFFNGFKAGDTLAQIQAAVKPATFSTPSITSFPNVFLAPHDIEWNFEIQHSLNAHNLFSLNYVGNHGYDLQETDAAANGYTSAAGVAMYGGAYGGLPTAAPDSRFVGVTQYYNNGVSNFNGLTIQYRHTYSYGLTAQIHYTWSHTLGTVAYENPLNLNNSYGNLGFDNRHQMAADFVWVQPHKFANRVANGAAGGWILSSKVYLYSGAPFSVTDSKIPAQINSAGGLLTSVLADVIVPSAVNANCGGVAVNAPCLTPSDFATYKSSSGVGTAIQSDWGNVAPESFRGPGYFDIDAQLTRDIRIKERMVLTLGMQTYNVLNHANFANPSGSLSSSSFGLITTTLGPPTSIYGTGQGAAVSGRLAVLTGRFTF